MTSTAGFIAFPIAGLAGRGGVGRVDEPLAALVGGNVAGAVIGTGQWLASRREIGEPAAWIGATAGGMGVGLVAGASAVDYETDLGDFALMGAIIGVPPGRRSGARHRPPLATRVELGAGHAGAVGTGMDREHGDWRRAQYVVFGAAGAITVMALSGLLFEWLRGAHRPAARPQTAAE